MAYDVIGSLADTDHVGGYTCFYSSERQSPKFALNRRDERSGVNNIDARARQSERVYRQVVLVPSDENVITIATSSMKGMLGKNLPHQTVKMHAL